MPDLSPVRQFGPLTPYDHVFDNGPINDLVANINLINDVLENISQDFTAALGTQGSLANRLNVSTNADGTLKASAIDTALHNIAMHDDGADGDGTQFVRMLQSERNKLSQVDDEATNLSLNISTLTTTVLYDAGQVNFNSSDTIAWRVDNTGLYADVLFSLASRHKHYYDIEPTPLNLQSPDYQNYTTTSMNTAYIAGSLRVYVNGVRISHQDTSPGAPDDASFPRIDIHGNVGWVSLNYTEDTTVTNGVVTTGKFALSTPILSSDRIIIDFDQQLSS